jgi:NNP family nitrate/nitrite transporter-like MFS transporter
MADRYGGKNGFVAAMVLLIVPVVALAFAHTYVQLVLPAVFLGIGGASFAIGVPFVSAWFPPEKRGFVIGVYSMGNAGTAVSGFATPRFANAIGRGWTFAVVALLLAMLALMFFVWVKNAPGWRPSKGSSLQRLMAASKSRITWDLASVYVITFGAFVAFGVYLPVLLKVAYGLSLTDAAARAAGFVLLATIARPIGGWLGDHIGSRRVITAALVAVIVLATIVALQSTLQFHTTAAYLSLAFALGCGNGAVFALVGKLAQSATIGSVTGIVGAAGGLGGFLPPLVLGLTYQWTHTYSLALGMLAVSAFVVLMYITRRFRSPLYAKVAA